MLEGFHALKHAARFGAEILEIVTSDRSRIAALAGSLAPDLLRRLDAAEEVPSTLFHELSPHPPREPVIALARRAPWRVEQALAAPAAPIVFLESPRNPGNIGAVVRVAAAAGAAGVLTTGEHDPWTPAALRGSAGLHYALPVLRVEVLPESGRPLIALHPEGDDLAPGQVPPAAVLAFGSERAGLSRELLARADMRVAIPMRQGVSSLSLATAVAVMLYRGTRARDTSTSDVNRGT